MPAGGAGDRHRVPVRRFEQDVHCGHGHLGRRAAHDGGKRDDTRVVGDDEVLGVERAVRTVQCGQPLPRSRPAHQQRPGEPAEVERVHRLAEFEHHVVGDVDGE